MEAFEEDWGPKRFFEIVDLHGLWPNASLQSLSGYPAPWGPFETPLIQWVEEAYATPIKRLTCEQVRLLLSQKMELKQLADPIIEFVSRFPRARITNYEGEMVALSLRAATEFLEVTPNAYKNWLSGDFAWLEACFGWDVELSEEVTNSVAKARNLALHS